MECVVPINCPYGYFLTGDLCLPLVQDTTEETIQDESFVEESPTMKTGRCKTAFGIYSIWSGGYDSSGGITCSCLEGRDFINGGKTCEVVPIAQNETLPVKENNTSYTQPAVENETTSPEPANVTAKNTSDINNEVIRLEPLTGYINSSAAFRTCPSTSCSVIRYYAETSTVDIDARNNDGTWYRVNGRTDAGGRVPSYWVDS